MDQHDMTTIDKATHGLYCLSMRFCDAVNTKEVSPGNAPPTGTYFFRHRPPGRDLRSGRITLCVITIIVLFGSSYLTNFMLHKVLPVESEILSELRTVSGPIETEITDIYGFKSRIDKGYVEETGVTDGTSSWTRPEELDMEINTMNLQQLLNCIYYLYSSDEAIPYVDRAYELCEATEQTDRFNVGEMWYYHAYYYDYHEYANAAEEFKSVGRDWNAAGAYYMYYERANDSNGDLYYNEFYNCVQKALLESQTGAPLSYCDSWYAKAYFKDSHGWWDARFASICEAVPDDAFLNILNVISGGRDQIKKHESIIDHLLGMEKYRNCPKLLLLKAYCSKDPSLVDRIYTLYVEHVEWFETEDRVNLAWLFYERGDYNAVFAITTDHPTAALVRAESFIQMTGNNVFNLNTLYNNLREAIKGAFADEELADRIILVKNIIEQKLGINSSYEGLSDACKKVLNSDSSMGKFIIASLSNEDGKALECNEICNQLLNEIGDTDPLYYRVLFLKSDALIKMASMSNPDIQRQLYLEAESILMMIESRVGEDYVMCLERMAKLYQAMGPEKQEELELVTKKLVTLR